MGRALPRLIPGRPTGLRAADHSLNPAENSPGRGRRGGWQAICGERRGKELGKRREPLRAPGAAAALSGLLGALWLRGGAAAASARRVGPEGGGQPARPSRPAPWCGAGPCRVFSSSMTPPASS